MEVVKENIRLVGVREGVWGVRWGLLIGCGHPWSSQPKQEADIDWAWFARTWGCCEESQPGSCSGKSQANNPPGRTHCGTQVLLCLLFGVGLVGDMTARRRQSASGLPNTAEGKFLLPD